MLDFMMRIGGITSELNRLLTIRFVPGHSGHKTQIEKQVAALVPLWNSGRKQEFELELLRLAFLVKHLKEIEAADAGLLLHFRKAFRRAGTTLSYHGMRFEAYVAATLIRSGLPFTKSEAPDFLIKGSELGLECTSARISNAHGKLDLSYKIQSKITDKARTRSNRPETALLIDITNIAHNVGTPDIQAIRSVASSSLHRTAFGAIVLFIYMFNHDLKRYETNYLRVDSLTLIDPLRSLLDQIFQVTGHDVDEYQIPLEG